MDKRIWSMIRETRWSIKRYRGRWGGPKCHMRNRRRRIRIITCHGRAEFESRYPVCCGILPVYIRYTGRRYFIVRHRTICFRSSCRARAIAFTFDSHLKWHRSILTTSMLPSLPRYIYFVRGVRWYMWRRRGKFSTCINNCISRCGPGICWCCYINVW